MEQHMVIAILPNALLLLIFWFRIESRLSRLEGRFDQFIHNRKGGDK